MQDLIGAGGGGLGSHGTGFPSRVYTEKIFGGNKSQLFGGRPSAF